MSNKANMTSAQIEAELKAREEAFKKQKEEYKRRLREAKSREAKAAKQKRDQELIELGLEYEKLTQAGTLGTNAEVENLRAELSRVTEQRDIMFAFIAKERNRNDGRSFSYMENLQRENPDVDLAQMFADM